MTIILIVIIKVKKKSIYLKKIYNIIGLLFENEKTCLVNFKGLVHYALKNLSLNCT